MPRKARQIDKIPPGGRRPKPRCEAHPFFPIKSMAPSYGSCGSSPEPLSASHARPPLGAEAQKPPSCRYCGEPSIWPWGGQQVCERCEAIRERIERAAFPPERMGDDELYRSVLSVLAQRERQATLSERIRCRTASPWGKVAIVVVARRPATRALS
jgi:hypothetical protein